MPHLDILPNLVQLCSLLPMQPIMQPSEDCLLTGHDQLSFMISSQLRNPHGRSTDAWVGMDLAWTGLAGPVD
jgi:hypothetical protein